MEVEFFADYKAFVVTPIQDPIIAKWEFHPQDYEIHYILTLSLYDSLIAKWRDAIRYDLDAKGTLKKVVEEFNYLQRKSYHLTLLEMDMDQSYCVMALSCKNTPVNQEVSTCISTIVDTILLTPLYIGQSWYRLVGMKGRTQRKLFSFSFKEYSSSRSSNLEAKSTKLIPYPASHILTREG